MKKHFTLLFVIYLCISLSAEGLSVRKTLAFSDTPLLKHQTDSARLFPIVHAQANPKHKKHSVKLITDLAVADQTKLKTTPVIVDNSQQPSNESVKLITDLLMPDYNKSSTAHHYIIPIAAEHRVMLISDLLITDESKLKATPKTTDTLEQPATQLPPVKMITDLLITDKTKLEPPADAPDKYPPIATGLQLDSLKEAVIAERIKQEDYKRQLILIEQAKFAALLKSDNPDSIRMVLQRPLSDTLKGMLYTHLAGYYMRYDTLTSKTKRTSYQNLALTYTLLAIQKYARYNDTIALRNSFDNLAKVYYAQNKFTEAKWFTLQSNSLSRAKNDTANIINSLLVLASIKMDIMDYALAQQDLNEALRLATTIHSPKVQLRVVKQYAALYDQMNDLPKLAAMIKKRDSLEQSIRKSELAALAAENARQKKKLDSLQAKKKCIQPIRGSYPKTALPKKSPLYNSVNFCCADLFAFLPA